MEILPILPHFQAILNAVSLILICLAFIAVKSGDKERHKKLMIAALAVSSVFLVSYLYYHAHIGHVPFKGEGGIRTVYFTILFTHILMAAIALVLIIMAVWRALIKQDYTSHKKVARFTFPIWAFVCASGIVVYVMAFHIYTGSA
ncbi:Predicted membrane protein [Candidatus Terasakiella magnetica]|uniref:Predicted membrane protein n=1 Tax=Candidatus Terasakiella magnetica TaxID=1867952 RepID=A0A1C3RC60_9PROT|nr:DUF420 domain-containing protein [Candidatus Terasakiella magnetica]SCA54867.1 Predicted membrane protein [Candidatus Terasakiella magnetica]